MSSVPGRGSVNKRSGKDKQMKLTTIRDIFRKREDFIGKKITVGGWVRSVRASKAFGFIILHDGTFFEPLQVVYHDNMDNFKEVSRLNVGAALIVTGTLVATPDAKQPSPSRQRRRAARCSCAIPHSRVRYRRRPPMP